MVPALERPPYGILAQLSVYEKRTNDEESVKAPFGRGDESASRR
jgi:hypothetical protein